ncbi:hypothetical protein [uncultured Aliiroseovarius sp.]|uniref:hypothetical protein n=1 Tax=uncultured Aliiroseovarius sp. TaxID=1658783 RepID=UPI00260C1C62|nr:hypothetical protein [uncultured Aliiroseovarius sp.]
MADVDTRVPLSLHPDNITSMSDVDDDTRVFVNPAAEALEAAHTYLGSIYDVREAAFSDPTLTEPAALLKTDDHAMAKLEAVTRKLDGTLAAMGKTIKAYEAQLVAPVKEKAGAVVSTEIRAHLKVAPNRIDLVRQAIKNGDDEVACAALGGPAMLSGLTPEIHSVLLREYHEVRQPVVAKRVRAMTAARDYLEINGPRVLKEAIRAVGGVQVPIPGPDGKTVGFRTEGPDAYRRKRNASAKVYRKHA